ncbi:MAG: hypothetical protein OIN86_02875 [Candidatus Methanoperedens sp.]|nr:hypothetical protein [Candidatus Methanoperedens sp.]CAG0979809.1 hypothetical protein METP1_01708 [Methanosarcinales archaeon]
MKFRRDKDFLGFLGMSLGMIFLGAIISLFIQSIFFIGFGFILGGLALLVSGLYTGSKPGTEVMINERVLRINEKAGYHTYWMIMGIAGFLWVLDIYLKLNMNLSDGLALITFTGLYAFLVLRYYFGKKGVEE